MDEISNIAAEPIYYALLAELDQERMEDCEVGLVGAGLGDIFNQTSELHVMKYKEAINGPNDEAWKEVVNNNHEQMIKYKV